MTTYAEIANGAAGKALNTIILLLLCAQAFTLVTSIWERRKAHVMAMEGAHFVATFALFVCMLEAMKDPRYSAAFLRWFYACPVWVIAVCEALSLVLVVLTVVNCAHYARSYLWTESIKQAIDALPVAVCVGTPRRIFLVNVQMNEYCVAVFETAFDSVDALWERVCAEGATQGDSRLVRREGVTLLFGKSEVQVDGKLYTQVTAFDVTEQYRITAELQEKNAKLREVQLRELEVRYETEALARNKELLSARVRVHDEIGHILLVGKYYFEHVDQDDAALLATIKQSSELLLGTEDELQGQTDEYQEAVRWAQSMGVEVRLRGDVPHQFETRKVVAQAVKECATNAVKHADATYIEVRIESNLRDVVVVIVNDGKPPKGEIVLSGGLLSLQKSVENAGGLMIVRSTPDFSLTMVLRA